MTSYPSDHIGSTFDIDLPLAPYPGLRPFDIDEWPVFFGREKMTDQIIDQLIDKHLVVVHGDSGCGKSSLIRAGVLAQLRQEHARNGVSWRTSAMLPRDKPLWRLAKALAELTNESDDVDYVRKIRRQLNLGISAPAALQEMLRRNNEDQYCILIDQFEELFDFAKGQGHTEAGLFVDILVSFCRNPPPGFHAIITMRSEFLGHCARYRGLAETVNATQYLLSRMEHQALIRAIREPAPLFDGEVTRRLSEQLVADAGDGQDQLPLIQHGLMLLWRRKIEGHEMPGGLAEAAQKPFGRARHPDWTLDLPDYKGAGGLEALLSAHADEVMVAVAPDPERQSIVEHMFRALTDINAEGQATRRPRTLRQLAEVTDADNPTLSHIIDTFRSDGVSFLNPYGADPLKPEDQIDISHEALIRCWGKIADEDRGWLQREFKDGLIWKTLRVSAQQGETLSPAATEDREAWLETLPSPAWANRYNGGWQDIERLMAASRRARDEEKQRLRELDEAKSREAETRARQAEEARKAAAEIAETEKQLRTAQEAIAREAEANGRKFRRLAIVAAFLALVATLGFGFALDRQFRAAKAASDAKEAAAREKDAREEALKLADAADKARKVVISGLAAEEFDNGREVPAFRLALLSNKGAYSWRAANAMANLAAGVPEDRIVTENGHRGAVYSVAFSPDGRRIVSGSRDYTLRLWNADTGEQIKSLIGHGAAVNSVAFSHNGERVLSGSSDNTLRLWDAESGELVKIFEGHRNSVYSVAFSSDSKRLLSGSKDKTLRLWDAEKGETIRVFRGHQGGVWSVTFSPDDKRVLSGSNDNTLRLWNADTGEFIKTFEGHHGWAFSPDGKPQLNGSKENKVHRRGGKTDQLFTELDARFGLTTSLVFLDDDRFLTADHHRYIDLWDIKEDRPIWTSRTRNGGYLGLAIDPEKRWVAASTFDGSLWIYDLTTPMPRPVTRYDLSEKAYRLDVSSVNGRIAVPLEDGRIELLKPQPNLTWEGVIERAEKIANGPLTDEEKRRLDLYLYE